MNIIQDGETVLVIGSQHIYRVDPSSKSTKCIYDGPTIDTGAKADSSSGSASEEEEEERAKKRPKKSTTQPLAWTGVGAVSGEHLLLCDSLKGIHLLNIGEEQHPKLISRTRLEKAATAVVIHDPKRGLSKGTETREDRVVYVADKFGEVWTCPLNDLLNKENTLRVIAGHISLLTDMIIHEDFILTCDRDEKIRITLRDRPWIIDQFLLEHKEYVSRMAILGAEHLVTGGGDKELMLWHWKPGKFAGLRESDAEFREQEAVSRATLVEKMELDSTEENKVDVIGIAVRGDAVSVILEGNPNIVHLQLVEGHLKRLGDIKLDSLPACITYTRDGLLVGLEDGKLLLYPEGSPLSHELVTIPDPITRRCSHLRKTVHRLTDD